MSDWQDKNDFEINKAVVDSCDTNGLIPFVNNERSTVYLCEKDGINSLNMVCDFDPCNSPSDAWPIIELMFKAGVTLMINDGGVTTSNLGEKYGGKSIDINCKPLRAAMIVYLEINGVKPNE